MEIGPIFSPGAGCRPEGGVGALPCGCGWLMSWIPSATLCSSLCRSVPILFLSTETLIFTLFELGSGAPLPEGEPAQIVADNQDADQQRKCQSQRAEHRELPFCQGIRAEFGPIVRRTGKSNAKGSGRCFRATISGEFHPFSPKNGPDPGLCSSPGPIVPKRGTGYNSNSMNQYRELLLDVWREACRHIEITQLDGDHRRFFGPAYPHRAILVRRIDQQRNCVETVARAATRKRVPGGEPGDARNECRPEHIEAILRWCRAGKVVQGHCRFRPDRCRPAIFPGAMDGDVLAGPLELHDDRFGVLLLVAQPAAVFRTEHAELVQVLLEPFAAALENDRHVAEMAALREAAEADKRSLLKRLGREKLGSDTIVGIGSGLRAVMERVALVSKSDVPVLIFGETGSGKEVVARAIHNGSPRAERPFIRVNCGAIPHELIDSQLFGHEKGAFTGATETRQGWFERADGGTLLLDELAELPLAAQVRLLRILQDGWLDRVGGQRPINVDVRIVAATHRDLPAMVAAGQFREDLWYRLAVFPIAIPPLRERREDIPELARHFARRAATRFGLYPAEPTAEDIQLLVAYPGPATCGSWPR